VPRALLLAPLALLTLGVGLHLYQLLFKFDGPRGLFAIGLALWSCLWCALAQLWARRAAAPAAGFALGALLGDAWTHHAVFIAPGSSTAALGLALHAALQTWHGLAQRAHCSRGL
jgi:hypothetical protein